MNATETQNGYYRDVHDGHSISLLAILVCPQYPTGEGQNQVQTMHENADMQVINLHVAVEKAYKKGYSDGRTDIDNPYESLTHYKEMKSWSLGTRQDLMALSGMSRDDHTGLHNGHGKVGVICDGFDSRDTPIPIRESNTRHTYDKVMTAYDWGFVDKCDGKDKEIPYPDEL